MTTLEDVVDEWPRRVELPRGAYAILRDPELVPDRLRRPLARLRRRAVAAAMSAGLTPSMAAAMAASTPDDVEPDADDPRVATLVRMAESTAGDIDDEFGDHLVAALVVEWSFDAEITPDAVADLPGPVVDALTRECMPLVARLFPSFEPDISEQSPTGPSRSSKGRSRAPRSTSTASSPADTAGSA